MSKRDFGSFHASNVQELISLSEEEYQPPNIPIELPQFNQYHNSDAAFGNEIKKRHFLLEENCTFINHGAFGAVIKDVLQVAQKWQLYIDRQPVRFFDRELLPHLVYVTRRMAKFIGCDPSDIVLLPNVTTGINSVLKSFPLEPGDEVLYFNTEYGANKKVLKSVCSEKGVILHEENIEFPVMNPDQITESLLSGIHDRTKLLIVDHIPSNTPFVMPVKEIVEICHARNVKVLVDGAHALGQLELNIKDLDADFYAANCHKWFGACKGTALLYVARPFQDIITPLVISHGYDFGFISKFSWTGLRDYSSFLALHTALDFWTALNPARMREYMHTLARHAADMLVTTWETGLLASPDMTESMLCVQLPKTFYEHLDDVCYSHAEIVQNALFHQFNIEVPIKAINNVLYVRISSHIYNTMEDYQRLAEAIQAVKVQPGILELLKKA